MRRSELGLCPLLSDPLTVATEISARASGCIGLQSWWGVYEAQGFQVTTPQKCSRYLVSLSLEGFELEIILTSDCQTRPKLYFVKVDVQACFDTIEQDKLLEILRDLISEVILGYITYSFSDLVYIGRIYDPKIRSSFFGCWQNQALVCQEGYPRW